MTHFRSSPSLHGRLTNLIGRFDREVLSGRVFAALTAAALMIAICGSITCKILGSQPVLSPTPPIVSTTCPPTTFAGRQQPALSHQSSLHSHTKAGPRSAVRHEGARWIIAAAFDRQAARSQREAPVQRQGTDIRCAQGCPSLLISEHHARLLKGLAEELQYMQELNPSFRS